MNDVAQVSEFPFLAEVQAAQEKRGGPSAQALEELSIFREASEAWGGLIVSPFARMLLGISKQGVADLAARGKIRSLQIAGVNLYSLADVLARMQGEKGQPGRPCKPLENQEKE